MSVETPGDLMLCFAFLFFFLLGSSITASTGEALTNPSIVEGLHGEGNPDFFLFDVFFLGCSALGVVVSVTDLFSCACSLPSSSLSLSGVAGVEG